MKCIPPFWAALCLLPTLAYASSNPCRTAWERGDYPQAVLSCRLALDSGGGPEDALALAGAHRGLFELQPMLEAYREGILRFGTVELYRAFAADLLAFNLTEQADQTLDEALIRFPADATLMELEAVSEAYAGRDDEACAWIRRSWAAGADPRSWAEDTLFGERAFQIPYRDLLDPRRLAADLSSLPEERRAVRLHLLEGVMREEAAGAVTDLLMAGASAGIQRLGLADLAILRDRAVPYYSELLQSPDPSLRRKVLVMLWDLRSPATLPLLEEVLRHESDPRNAALAEVLAAALHAAASKNASPLESIAADHPFRPLADAALEDLYVAWGQTDRVRTLHERLLAPHPDHNEMETSSAGLPAYWECMERQDIRDMMDLLSYHRNVRRLDARIYGLPEDDFDDQQNLTVPERIFLRSWAKEQGLDWATEGVMQYPREIRHTLREIQMKMGLAPDCSGFLSGMDAFQEKTLQRDGNEVNASNDTPIEEESNVVVNPTNQAYVVATSNPASATGNTTYYSTNYGKTFSKGSVFTSGSCDPISFYNSNGTLYHAYLTYNGAIRVAYSANNGSSWTACSSTNLPNSSRDREDMYIDTFANAGGAPGWSASPCLNKIYVGYHWSGAQEANASGGTSSPYCNSAWGSRFSLASPGNGYTIGTGITSSIGKISGNGTVIYTFSRYGSGSTDTNAGIYYALSTDCGGSYGTPVKISGINTAGQFEWGVPASCYRMTYIYVQADTDRQPLSAYRNNIYIVWNDLSSACTAPGCTGNTTCNSDIIVAKGVPNDRDNPVSWTWTTVNLTKNIIGTDSYTDEFYPSLAVDQADGDIYVGYYRSNSGTISLTARQQQVHYVTVRSIDGGSTWQPVYQVTQTPTNEYNSGADTTYQWGDYTWVDVLNGASWATWTDRRDNADEEIFVSKICSEPTHWVERGASPAAPPTTATPGANKVITLSWTAPDLYWGDGGENNALRKYQLYVDGSLNQDNLVWTSTSTTYTASDCTTSHTFFIRAVNQCNVSKDYASTTVTATGCASGVKPVPDGRLTGTAMKGTRVTANGSTISVAYDTNSCTMADHSILYGNLANLSPLTPTGGACSIGNTSPYSWTSVPTGYNVWWVIVGDGGTAESSWGQKYSGGVYSERSTVPSNQCGGTTLDTTGTCP